MKEDNHIDEIIDAIINFKQASVDFASEAELFGDNRTVLYTANDRLQQLKETAKQAIEDFYRNKIPEITGETSDGYHTFNELYRYRLLYNAAFFNSMKDNPVWGFGEHKSRKHSDGEGCFGGGWFIVMAKLPTGQISNHYELKDWDLFDIPEKDRADEWDGHTPQDVEKRLTKYITAKPQSTKQER